MTHQNIADIIFIVSNEGIPFLVHDTKIDSALHQDPTESVLIAGFMSAIQSFLKSLTQADLRIIDGGNDKIIIHRDKDFSVAAITSLTLINEVMAVLIEIAHEFETHFRDILHSFEGIVSNDIFESFRSHVIQLIDVNRVITIGSNDIYRRYVSKYAKVGQKYIAEKYGESMLTFYSKLDGEKTMYQILFDENLLGVIQNFESKLKEMYGENLIQKIPMSQKNLQIISLTFNRLASAFGKALKPEIVIEQIKFILNSSANNLASLMQLEIDPLYINFRDIKQALEEDPTIALTKEFETLINPVMSFIANIQTSGKLDQNRINEILKKELHEISSLYPGDEFIEIINSKFGLMEL